MKGINIISLIFFLVIFQSCYKEDIIYNAEINNNLEMPLILKINGKSCCYDNTEKSLRYPINSDTIHNYSPLIEFQKYATIYYEGKILQNESINNIGKITINKKYDLIIETQNQIEQLSLTFTNLPIVQIVTPNKIFDEPKTLARIIINHTAENKASDTYFIGIEYRGGTSQSYKKKSYGVSLKGSMNLDNDISGSFFEMKKNNDWILDAMWIDKSRLRNKTSFELWNNLNGNIHRGINAEFVELFINNEHHGLYCLGEKINAEFLKISNPHAVIYKATAWAGGATLFETYNSNPPLKNYWDGWEQIYPDPGIIINWYPLNELRKVVVKESNEYFATQIETLIDLDNFIDYYIFLNITSAIDNTGKNTFLVKKNIHDKFYIVPWDLDGSWGLLWDGKHAGFSSVLSNNLFNRLLETNTGNFKVKVKERWRFLRDDVLSNEEIKSLFKKNFAQINQSNILAIENKKWGTNIDINDEQKDLMDWIDNRLLFLDNYFNNL